jgi:superfamily II helicase
MEETLPFTKEEFAVIMEGVGRLPFQKRMQAKQALLRVVYKELCARDEKIKKSIERSKKHFQKHTAHRPCVCGYCHETKTYAEMLVFDAHNPNDEENLCQDCAIEENEIEDKLLALDEEYDD